MNRNGGDVAAGAVVVDKTTTSNPIERDVDVLSGLLELTPEIVLAVSSSSEEGPYHDGSEQQQHHDEDKHINQSSDVKDRSGENHNDDEEEEGHYWNSHNCNYFVLEEWMKELPRWHDRTTCSSPKPEEETATVKTSDTSTKLPIPDSLHRLIKSHLLRTTCDDNNNNNNHVGSSMLIVRGVILIGIQLLYGENLGLKCRWIQYAQAMFGGGRGTKPSQEEDADSTMEDATRDPSTQQQNSCGDDYYGDDDDDDDDEDRQEHLSMWESLPETNLFWKEVQAVCSFPNWVLLLASIARNVAFFRHLPPPHPLLQYSKTILPILSQDERNMVRDLLQRHGNNNKIQIPQSTKEETKTLAGTTAAAGESIPHSRNSISFLGLMQTIEQRFGTTPTVYVVLLDPTESKKVPHSCIPNASIHVTAQNTTKPSPTTSLPTTTTTTTTSSSLLSTNVHGENDGTQTGCIVVYPNNSDNRNNNKTTGNCEFSMLSLCRIEDIDDVEQRQQQVLLLTGQSCTCLRCRYELFYSGYSSNESDDNDNDSPDNRDRHNPALLFLQQQYFHQRQSPNDGEDNNNWFLLQRLGRFYLGTKQDLDQAEPFFRALLFTVKEKKKTRNVDEEKKSSSSNFWDAWHALGAIELSRNRFLKAQRIWQEAKQNYETENKNSSTRNGTAGMNTLDSTTSSNSLPEGLKLQWAKLEAYDYFSTSSSTSSSTATTNTTSIEENQTPVTRNMEHNMKNAMSSYQSVIPRLAFRVSNVISKNICKQIIQWANDYDNEKGGNGWTQQRHYAVPTFDIPVHDIPSTLKWYRSWFETTVCPLLSKHFSADEKNNNKNGRHGFYTHDAFVVKYDATATRSNYLPVHTDESTHSFVLALNENFTGGGTYLAEYDTVVPLRTGEMLCFRGDQVEHGGEQVNSDTRYILAAFLYQDDSHGNDDEKIIKESRTENKSGFKDREQWQKSDMVKTRKKRSFQRLSENDTDNNFSFQFNVPDG